MKRLLVETIAVAGLLLAGMATGGEAPSSKPVTFNKDVLPILQRSCQTCHRPGEVAPMPLLTYEQTRPWARSIKTQVMTKQMPPWFADPEYGHFSNERKLTPEEIRTLVLWVNNGAPEGDAKDKPAPVEFVEGWGIGTPDKVIEMPKAFQVPAQGTVDYKYVVLTGGFTQDAWVKAAEIRPGNRAVVHHVIAFIRPPGSPWLKDAQPGVPGERSALGASGPAQERSAGGGILGAQYLVGFAPGSQAETMGSAAERIPAGSDIVFQIHYTTNGAPAEDRTRIGLVLAKEPPQHQYVTLLAANHMLAIPPGDSNYEVKSQVTFQEPAKLVSLKPHMHLRGKDFEYRVVYPTGESETLLKVSKYDFNWQLRYKLAKPLDLPKGARIECIAHFDNSLNNAANPDPTKLVRWGEQSWEEMMIGWFSVEASTKDDPRALVRMSPGANSKGPAL